MATQTISTLTGAAPLSATVGLLISAGGPTKVFNIEGYCNGTANTQYFLQVYPQKQLGDISGGDKPLRSLQVLGANGFTFSYGPVGLDLFNINSPNFNAASNQAGDQIQSFYSGPLVLVLSSTEASFTAVAGGATCDVSVDIEQGVVNFLNPTTVGNLDSSGVGVGSLAVWTDVVGNASKKLVGFNAINIGGPVLYIQLFAFAAPDGAFCLSEWVLSNATTGVFNFDFGSGVAVQSRGYSTSAGVVNYTPHYGCYLYASTTPGYKTAAANGMVIQAMYI